MASPEEMRATMIANLKPNTGKDLAAWLKVLKAAKLEKHGALVKYLKTEHGVTHGYANTVTFMFLNPEGSAGGTDLVDAMYSGKKAGLRPIYAALVKLVEGLGSEAELSPKKTYVSLRRSKQFGLIQASTQTRVDLGLNLKGTAVTDRLEASGSFNQMVSHRVRLSTPEEVDGELRAWLKAAFDLA